MGARDLHTIEETEISSTFQDGTCLYVIANTATFREKSSINVIN